MTPPLFPAYIASGSQWAVWCPDCGCLHFHGKVPGHRQPHCTRVLRAGEHLEGYYLIPSGEPLPAEAKKLDSVGRRRIKYLLYAKKPKQTPPQPVPEWGRPIEDRDYALSLLAVWSWQEGKARGEEFQKAMTYWSRVIPSSDAIAAAALSPRQVQRVQRSEGSTDDAGIWRRPHFGYRHFFSITAGGAGKPSAHPERNMEHIATQDDDLKSRPEQMPTTEQDGNDRKISSEDIARILTGLRNTPTEELSVAERLTLRAVDRQFTITLDSERGPIAIVCRVPTPAEYQDLIEMQKTILQLGAITLQGVAVCKDIANGNDGDGTDRAQKLREMRTVLHESKKSLADAQRRLSEILAAVTVDPSLTVNFFNAGILAHEEISLIAGGLLQHGQPHPLRMRMTPTPSCEG